MISFEMNDRKSKWNTILYFFLDSAIMVLYELSTSLLLMCVEEGSIVEFAIAYQRESMLVSSLILIL